MQIPGWGWALHDLIGVGGRPRVRTLLLAVPCSFLENGCAVSALKVYSIPSLES